MAWLAGLLAAGVLLAGCDAGAPHFHSTDITGGSFGHAFSLTDPEGVRRGPADFKGRLVVVFFGYTQCPDVCPTTLAEWAEVRRQLGPDGARVQVIFVTLDPERDTPGLLAHYVQAFDPGTLALTGTPAEIATVAKDFKVFYEKVPGAAPGQYTLNHTAASYVFDPQGRLRLFIRQGQAVSDTVADLRVLLAAKPS